MRTVVDDEAVFVEGHLQLNGLEQAGAGTRKQRDTACRWLQFFGEIALNPFTIAVQAFTFHRSLVIRPGSLPQFLAEEQVVCRAAGFVHISVEIHAQQRERRRLNSRQRVYAIAQSKVVHGA